MTNDTISISDLKINPTAAIAQASDYPLEVVSRGKSQAYLIGKNLFEALLNRLEDVQDKKIAQAALENGDLSAASDFEEFARDLGI